MAKAIHIELDILFFLILYNIAYQSARNVSQQMQRVLFRRTVYGIMAALLLDAAWMVMDGVQFPGGIVLNAIINALFLSLGVTLGCLWYLYVLESLGYEVTKKLTALVMIPAYVSTVLNIASLKTGWIFYITPENVYVRGPWFMVQTVMALLALLISLFHILFRLTQHEEKPARTVTLKLLKFYIIPVIGTLVSMPFTGMPGTWTCASVSIILIYMDDQDNEIVRDSLTGLNNRKTLKSVFSDYVRQVSPVSKLFLFMMDLDNFKGINDTLGHPTGDQALVNAANLFLQNVSGLKGIVARIGGDEFLIMGFFPSEADALALKARINDSFARFNEEKKPPYRLAASIGICQYRPGQTLGDFIEAADERLYEEKKAKHVKR